MEKKIETPLKEAVIGKGLVIRFEAIVKYDNDPNNATDKEIQQDPNKYRFQSIQFKAVQLEADGKKDASTQDSDVQKINSTIYWNYGSLQPLKAKPRILDQATTVKDLTDAGVKAGTAKRIVDFVKAEPLSAAGIKGGNKKQKLAIAVMMHAKLKRKPNMTGWKATDVLWT